MSGYAPEGGSALDPQDDSDPVCEACGGEGTADDCEDHGGEMLCTPCRATHCTDCARVLDTDDVVCAECLGDRAEAAGVAYCQRCERYTDLVGDDERCHGGQCGEAHAYDAAELAMMAARRENLTRRVRDDLGGGTMIATPWPWRVSWRTEPTARNRFVDRESMYFRTRDEADEWCMAHAYLAPRVERVRS